MLYIAGLAAPARCAGLAVTLAGVRRTRLIRVAAECVTVARHRTSIVGDGQ